MLKRNEKSKYWYRQKSMQIDVTIHKYDNVGQEGGKVASLQGG